MRKFTVCVVMFAGISIGAGGAGALLLACGTNSGSGVVGFNPDSGTGPGQGNPGGDGGVGNPGSGDSGPVVIFPTPDSSTTPPVTYTDGGCAGLQCQITSCGDGGSTTIVGKVMDPAGANPLYNVLAYVPMYDPAQPSTIPAGQGIQPIQGGVTFPSGVSCDSCSYLFSGNPIAVGLSGTDGTFTIANAPSGTNIPVVVQIGKWRAHTTVSTVTACGQADAGSINLPSSADGTDPIVSMPQIAISMGKADSLECLPYRMGLALSEFTSGPSTTGHIHIFTGGRAGGGGGMTTSPPTSSTGLWDTIGDLEKYDVTLFSCEGAETTAANPTLLEQYVNEGGRAFLSHYHYAWLAGPLKGGGGGTYTAPADWGTNLATWNKDDQGASMGATIGAEISTTLNVDGGVFQKGQALDAWLGNVKALGTNAVPAAEVAINSPSFDPSVTKVNTVSQAWATYDPATDLGDSTSATTFPTAYFSFDTPVGATAPPDGGSPPYCGRVVFSGLHVGAAANDSTGGKTMPSATTCDPTPGNLSPQEKVLEFMLFDLSSCVTPDTAAPGIPIPVPPPPPPK